MSRLFLTIYQGDSPAQGVPLLASEDPRLIRAVAAELGRQLNAGSMLDYSPSPDPGSRSLASWDRRPFGRLKSPAWHASLLECLARAAGLLAQAEISTLRPRDLADLRLHLQEGAEVFAHHVQRMEAHIEALPETEKEELRNHHRHLGRLFEEISDTLTRQERE